MRVLLPAVRTPPDYSATASNLDSLSPPSVTLQMTVDGTNGGLPAPIFSFSLGATNTGAVAGGGGGRAIESDVTSGRTTFHTYDIRNNVACGRSSGSG